MSKPEFSKDLAYKNLQEFFTYKPFIFFATGTSCAVDLKFSMWALESYLKEAVPPVCDNEGKLSQWEGVVGKLDSGVDFESAMDEVKDADLVREIVRLTADCVAEADKLYRDRVLAGEVLWPAGDLFKKLMGTLTDDDPHLHVATPNYDMLAEYSFNHLGINCLTGFWGHVIKQLEWDQAIRGLSYTSNNLVVRKSARPSSKLKKHIRLYKVHGSLNVFEFQGRVVECDSWAWGGGSGERVMITPGTTKHESLHRYRDELLGQYDTALKKHNSFLFLGFGFNDSQFINQTLINKINNAGNPVLIVTRDTNDRIMQIAAESGSVWVVCKHEDEGNESTRIFNSKYTEWLYLPDKEIWKFDEFSNEILGA